MIGLASMSAAAEAGIGGGRGGAGVDDAGLVASFPFGGAAVVRIGGLGVAVDTKVPAEVLSWPKRSNARCPNAPLLRFARCCRWRWAGRRTLVRNATLIASG